MSHALLAFSLWQAAASIEVAPVDVDDAVAQVMAHAREAVRVALPPVIDDDPARAAALERELTRALIDRRREEVITPAFVRGTLSLRATKELLDVTPEQLRPFACDHVLLSRVLVEEGSPVLRLSLVLSETGEVLGTATLPAAAFTGDRARSQERGTSARNVRAAAERIVEEIAWAIESSGQQLRTHRTAVTPFNADDAAREGRLDRVVEAELVRALKARGFLVVERAQLAAALEQQALAQLDDSALAKQAPQVGQALGAQSLVVGTLAAAGTVFSVSARVISTETGAVLGAGTAELAREGVALLAAVETRTPLEAGVRSAVAPGWGQAYNQQGDKALVFAVAGYGGLLTTAGLGVGGVLAHARYNDVGFFSKLPEASRAGAVLEAKALADALYVSAAVAGGITATVWSLGVVDAIVASPP